MTRTRRPIDDDDNDNLGLSPIPRYQDPFFLRPKFWAMGILGLFLVMAGCQSVFTTDAGTIDLVLRWGAPVRVTEPGLNFKIPFIESDYTIELRERAYSVKLESASKDPMEVNVEVTLNWAVNKDQVVQMYYQFGTLDQFEKRIIAPRVPDAVKAVVSTFLVNDLLLKRNDLRDNAKKAVFAVVPQEIMTITGFAVTNVEFPKAYTKQIADVQVAREAANAQKYDLEKQNYKAQEVFNTAKAQADADKARADGEAYAILTKGKSEVDILNQKATVLKNNPQIIDYERALRWNGSLPTTYMGGEEAAKLLFQLGKDNPKGK